MPVQAGQARCYVHCVVKCEQMSASSCKQHLVCRQEAPRLSLLVLKAHCSECSDLS